MEGKKKWYQKTPGIIALLVLFFPAGLFLMWKYSNWKPKAKWIITAVFVGLVFITSQASSNKTLSDKQFATQSTSTKLPAQEQVISNAQQTSSPSSNIQPPKINSQQIKVTKVIDGDTIEIEGGQRIRYIGIDTPETVDPRKPVQCFGKEASDQNKKLVEGKEVKLEKDVSETDKYGRLLRYVYVGDIFVNDYLVRQGYAHASSYPPDIKYQDQFTKAQNEASANSKGLWGPTCGVSENQTNEPTNDSNVTQNAINSQSGNCSIKGNISSSGEKIYHMPGQNFYDRTQINTSKGERWFCSESDALAAGWRKSKS